MQLSREQEDVAKSIAARMAKAKLQEDDGVFDDMILDMKKVEAQMLIQSSLEEQVRYLLSRFGGDALGAQKRSIDELLTDYVPNDEIIECGKCRRHDFRDQSRQEGQSWLCSCCKLGKTPNEETADA